ncbi:MAG: DegT/DnrJ/EryC1/StrS family aminotransferase [Lutibacter sp.]|nr:DegT/DnrJ/EryC1/StrS family aminotransferase [Lutibacter sp.]
MKKIPINKPSITELEISYVNDAITNGWGAKCYDYINRFEKDFTVFQETKYALATSSCTGAIHLALLALGIEADDEVIVPEITWIASAEPILYIGAKPVFVDVLENTWCIDPEKIEEAITPKTKAIIVVHIYGNLCNMDEIMKIAKKRNLVVLEDAAEALGSEYYGKKAGSIADAGVFSFHGTKTMTTGEGGIMVTNNEAIYEKAKILNDHGRNSKDPENKMFWMRNYGYKYKMSNLQAALGCAQISRIEELINKKREIFNWYKELLKDIPCQLNPELENTKNSYWLPTIVFDKSLNFNRNAFFELCKENGIDSRPFFFPLSSLPMFEELRENKVAYEIYERGINLPSFHTITYEEIEKVSNIIRLAING